MASKMQSDKSEQAAKKTGRDPFVLGSMISIPLSWYYFFVKGDRQRGLFVGLWAPTLLAIGSYFRQARMNEMMQEGPGDIVGRVQRMVREQ
ncbi:hypothetical protein [Halobacterium sp. R2-5]|uniref:hypothetical protein n=1 Tax=Halobacterium sp. R2-5 TaxID=2715751 RepID=UPI001FBA8EAA|nr:hypothetical protein [Halobacterium sp. R2-5]